ncbi:MAG TPA: peptidylprolyl isomerase [Chloroflexota bacterium]
MRTLLFLAAAVLLVGCGSPGSNKPAATPAATTVSALGAKFKQAPPLTINPNKKYIADLITDKGTITVQLLPKLAPLAVNSFVFLARHHYYDHNLFHRILQNFVIQTGDPTGTGSGGPGYTFRDELHKGDKYTLGTLAMGNTGPNSNGSQFFIVIGSQASSLPNSYTIFGHVIKGMAVAEKIGDTPVTTNPGSGEVSMPLVDVYLKTVKIRS